MARTRVILLLLLFIFLTLGGIKLAAEYSEIDISKIFSQVHFTPAHLFWALLFNMGVYFFDTARYYLLAKSMDENLSWSLCFQAVIANLFFAWITPGSALGAPAAAYVLNEKGVKLSHAITISFGRSSTLMLTATCVALSIIFSGVELPFPKNALMTTVYSIVGLLTFILFFFIFFSLINYKEILGKISKFHFLKGFISGAISALDRINYLITHAKLLLIPILISSFLFHVCFVGLLMVFSFEFGASNTDAILMPLLYMTYSLFLPTPGGSGLAEVTAESFFKVPITIEQALAMVIISRLFTYLVQIIIGVIYFFFVLNFKKIIFLKEKDNESTNP